MSSCSDREARSSVETKVLEIYKKENPSQYFIDRSEKHLLEWGQRRERLFRVLLNFPPKMFAGSDLLELGSGTGEKSIYYALWGARCTLVDMNDFAIEQTRAIFEKLAPHTDNHQFIESSLFDFESEKTFDIVLSDGVIHHTAAKEAAFRHLVSFLKPGGYVILGIGNSAGAFQRMLQRMLVYRFADSEDEIVEVSEKLFSEHIGRAEKYGNRTRRAIIFDNIVNPKHDNISVPEVLKLFREAGLEFYSSWPPIMPPILGDSPNRTTFDLLDFPEAAALSEAAWLAHDKDDYDEIPVSLASLRTFHNKLDEIVSYMNDFSTESSFDHDEFGELIDNYAEVVSEVNPLLNLTNKLKGVLQEVKETINVSKSGDLDKLCHHVANTRFLFRGTVGLGMNYFVGYRPSDEMLS